MIHVVWNAIPKWSSKKYTQLYFLFLPMFVCLYLLHMKIYGLETWSLPGIDVVAGSKILSSSVVIEFVECSIELLSEII